MISNLITNEIVYDERIRAIINSDYKNNDFVNLMRNITKEAIESNSFYKELADKENFNLDDLNKIDDLALIPRVPAPLFKESTGMYEKLLKIPLESPEFELWNVSSCTSGDPSLVGRSKDDIELLASMTIKCIYEFIPIPKEFTFFNSTKYCLSLTPKFSWVI